MTIALRLVDGETGFEVADTGVGFDPQRTAPGAGLTNIRDRIEAVGGTVRVTSVPGAGTVVAGIV